MYFIVGSEVSKYVAKHLVEHLITNEFYKNKDYPRALVEAFRTIDAKMATEEV